MTRAQLPDCGTGWGPSLRNKIEAKFLELLHRDKDNWMLRLPSPARAHSMPLMWRLIRDRTAPASVTRSSRRENGPRTENQVTLIPSSPGSFALPREARPF